MPFIDVNVSLIISRHERLHSAGTFILSNFLVVTKAKSNGKYLLYTIAPHPPLCYTRLLEEEKSERFREALPMND